MTNINFKTLCIWLKTQKPLKTKTQKEYCKGYRLFKSIDKKDIINAIENNVCAADVLRSLGCKVNDKNRRKLKIFCEENNISYEKLINQMSEEEYYRNPKYCKNCGKIIPYEKRWNENFCSQSCSTSYTNRFTKRKNLKNQIIKQKLKNHNKVIGNRSNKIPKLIKGTQCTVCGRENCNCEFCRLHPYSQLIGLIKVGLNESYIGTEKIFEEFERIKNIYYNEYWTLKKSILNIIEEHNFDISQKTMYNIFDHLGISRRSSSESQIVSVLSGRNYLSSGDITSKLVKSIKHISWNGKNFSLKSSYEEDYAKELDLLKVDYEFESLKIEYFDSSIDKTRIAIPDFYLPKTKEIIEIKSDFTLDIQEMKDRFTAFISLGYSPRLILEHEEIDLYNIENIISEERLLKIKTKNIKSYKNNISKEDHDST